jgi:AmmeMemoRadiSam system protein B
MTTDPSGQAGPPPFDPNSPHQQRPKLRPVRGFPVQIQGQTMMGLADARQISDRVVVTNPAVQVILPLMTGEKGLDDIATEVGRGLTREFLEPLVAQLDDAGLLFGPKFDSLVAKMHSDFDATPILPPASTAAFADALVIEEVGEEATEEQKSELGPARLREQMDKWIAQALEQAANPSFDELPKAIVAPHLDYHRGWLNYAAVWGRMRVVDRPERVIILGTNHFGEGTGVIGCDKGYQSPLGTCEPDTAFVAKMRSSLGETLFSHRYDHEREHSIELQIPWIQHCLGKAENGNFPKVFAALVHDPSVNNGESYDGKGIGIQPFIDSLKKAIAESPGKTLVVSSADLSHVGPAFGDKKPVAGDDPEVEQARNQVLRHDQEMIAILQERKPAELVSAMAWQQNPTRWCSVGNLVAAMMTVDPSEVELLHYTAAMDPEGMGLVSSMAMAMW